MTTPPMIGSLSARQQIDADLLEQWEKLAATPDRGYDSRRQRGEILADIDALLELLNETL